MKKWLLVPLLFLAGCLVTTTHKVEFKRKPGDLWWRDPCYAHVNSATLAVPDSSLSDIEYFEKHTIRWPQDWKQRHPRPIKKPTTSAKSQVF